MCIEYIASETNWTNNLSGLAILVIGFLGVYIAWRQWKTASYRYKLDLFEKRFTIYEAIIDFILSIRGGGKVLDEPLAIFKDKTLPVRFLFNDEIAEYISEIKEKAIDVQTYEAELDGMSSGSKKIDIQRKSSEARKWLYKQIDEKELNSNLGSFLKVAPS